MEWRPPTKQRYKDFFNSEIKVENEPKLIVELLIFIYQSCGFSTQLPIIQREKPENAV